METKPNAVQVRGDHSAGATHSPVVCRLAGLLIERRYRRVGCFLAWFGVLGLLVLAIPAVGGLLLAILSVRNHTAHIAGVDLLVFSAVGFDWLALWIPRPR